jgi:hypothetical protein
VQIDERTQDRLALELCSRRAVTDHAAGFGAVVPRSDAAIVEEKQPALMRQLACDVAQSGGLGEIDLGKEPEG